MLDDKKDLTMGSGEPGPAVGEKPGGGGKNEPRDKIGRYTNKNGSGEVKEEPTPITSAPSQSKLVGLLQKANSESKNKGKAWEENSNDPKVRIHRLMQARARLRKWTEAWDEWQKKNYTTMNASKVMHPKKRNDWIFTPEEEEAVKTRISNIINSADLSMCVQETAILAALTGGLTNQIDLVNTLGVIRSGGWENPLGRAKFSIGDFGTPVDVEMIRGAYPYKVGITDKKTGESLSGAIFEKYGCITSINSEDKLDQMASASQYGEFTVSFDQEKLRQNGILVTYTFGDSLHGEYSDNLPYHKYGCEFNVSQIPSRGRTKETFMEKLSKCNTSNDLLNLMGGSYIEAQYHSNNRIGASNIKTIFSRKAKWESDIGKKVLTHLKGLGRTGSVFIDGKVNSVTIENGNVIYTPEEE